MVLVRLPCQAVKNSNGEVPAVKTRAKAPSGEGHKAGHAETTGSSKHCKFVLVLNAFNPSTVEAEKAHFEMQEAELAKQKEEAQAKMDEAPNSEAKVDDVPMEIPLSKVAMRLSFT